MLNIIIEDNLIESILFSCSWDYLITFIIFVYQQRLDTVITTLLNGREIYNLCIIAIYIYEIELINFINATM